MGPITNECSSEHTDFQRLPMGAKTGANAVRYGPIQPDVLGLFVLVADS